MKIALLVAYDGTDFRGSARQRGRGLRTVQGVLEERIEFLLSTPVVTNGAGRTDAGVHASGQVYSFEAEADPAWLMTRLNRWLAPEISIRAAAIVPDDFDARFSAKRRVYEYALYRAAAPDPFLDRFAVQVRDAIDLRAMRAGVRALIGEHDFASFCRGGQGPTTRRIRAIRVREEGERIVVRVEGDSFCQQMVRSVVGLLLAVARGERSPGDVATVLAAQDRAAAATVAPAKGLTLVEVQYRPRIF